MASSSKRDARAADIQIARDRALRLRREGHTIREISRRLGCSVGRAHQLIQEAIAAIPQENAEAVRVLELQRIDRMLRGLCRRREVDEDGRVTGRPGLAYLGEPKAVAAAVKLMERRAKLLGLDAPSKVELAGKDGGPIVTAHADVLAKLDRLAAAERPGDGEAAGERAAATDTEPEPRGSE